MLIPIIVIMLYCIVCIVRVIFSEYLFPLLFCIVFATCTRSLCCTHCVSCVCACVCIQKEAADSQGGRFKVQLLHYVYVSTLRTSWVYVYQLCIVCTDKQSYVYAVSVCCILYVYSNRNPVIRYNVNGKLYHCNLHWHR